MWSPEWKHPSLHHSGPEPAWIQPQVATPTSDTWSPNLPLYPFLFPSNPWVPQVLTAKFLPLFLNFLMRPSCSFVVGMIHVLQSPDRFGQVCLSLYLSEQKACWLRSSTPSASTQPKGQKTSLSYNVFCCPNLVLLMDLIAFTIHPEIHFFNGREKERSFCFASCSNLVLGWGQGALVKAEILKGRAVWFQTRLNS